jgi:NAD(P)-dependent dehydrogenase (short-subunit alcohol dehydrogenase family)
MSASGELGRIEILVNNAGINSPVADVPSYPRDAWDRVIATDLTSVCARDRHGIEATFPPVVAGSPRRRQMRDLRAELVIALPDGAERCVPRRRHR